MASLFETYQIPLILALLIGVAIAWWAFGRRASVAPPVDKVHETPAVAPREGRGIGDQAAAAAADVTGQVIGSPVHCELPGASGPPDNLQMLKGVGPKLALALNENGIIRFDQIARLSDNEVAILESKLGPFNGRLTRDRVVEQAHYLARDDKDGFEAKFGNLGR